MIVLKFDQSSNLIIRWDEVHTHAQTMINPINHRGHNMGYEPVSQTHDELSLHNGGELLMFIIYLTCEHQHYLHHVQELGC